MSESTAKASRRQVRKAFGPDALDAINSHAAALVELQNRLTEAGLSYSALETRCDGFIAAQPRTFWQRVRWFLRG